MYDVTILYANIYLLSYIIDDSAQNHDQNTYKIISLKSEFTCYKRKCKSAFVVQVCVWQDRGLCGKK